jgi:hypothetical protein
MSFIVRDPSTLPPVALFIAETTTPSFLAGRRRVRLAG